MSAEIDGGFVVFLIGAFPDKFHLVRSFLDLGGRRGMKHVLDYLIERPDKGLLGYQMGWRAISDGEKPGSIASIRSGETGSRS